jgi:hypothetical protein
LGIVCLILISPSRAGAGSLVCPNKDLAGHPLQDQSFGSTIFCSYGIGLNCIYNMTTGDLMTDNDGGNCPSNAVTPMAAPTATPRSAAAPAPALTSWGLMVAAIVLVSVGVFELRHRMRRH